MSAAKPYLKIVSHYEECLDRHGDTHLGVDWADPQDAETRYRVMLDVAHGAESASMLDFGCGTAHLLDYMNRCGLDHIQYSGLDLSTDFIDLCRTKYPNTNFVAVDILDPGARLPQYDYIVMNGVFTEKGSLSFDEMFEYFTSMIRKIYPFCTRGMAFNVRSKQVNVEEHDLFHLPFDVLAGFLSQAISKHFTLRHDYGLEEYTVYVYRDPNR